MRNRTTPSIEDGRRWYANRLAKRKYDSIWRIMIRRCYDPTHHKYPSYGARGVRVCDRWLDPKDGYRNFESDMGERPTPQHTVDRKNNDGNYDPLNCWWATRKQQQRNRRVNALVTINDRTLCLSAWAEELGIKRSTLQRRLALGWTGEKLMKAPDQKFNRMRKVA